LDVGNSQRTKPIFTRMHKSLFSIAILSSLIIGCSPDDNPQDILDDVQDISALPLTVEYPANNTFTTEKEELGRMLFWDPILSGDKDIACASCHHPDFAYADGVARSLGVDGIGLGPDRREGTLIDRNSPTVINTAFNGINQGGNYSPEEAPMFWDLRESSLETQSIQPILSAEEMRGENYTENEIVNEVISRLQSIPGYVEQFELAFNSIEITEEKISQAIATFERTIIANNSRFDQYMRGDTDALTNQEVRGLQSFIEVGCADCHDGPMLSDFELHTLGVPNNIIDDRGANGQYDFRTPTLRNIELTAPYMHNGIFDSLEEVVDFYVDISNNRRNAINRNVNINDIDDDARELDIAPPQVNQIVSFLRTLTDNNFDKQIPESVPSTLPVGGNIDN